MTRCAKHGHWSERACQEQHRERPHLAAPQISRQSPGSSSTDASRAPGAGAGALQQGTVDGLTAALVSAAAGGAVKRITAGAPRDMMAMPSSNLRSGTQLPLPEQRVFQQPRGCTPWVSCTRCDCGQPVRQVNVRLQPLTRVVAVHRQLVKEGLAVGHLRTREARKRELSTKPCTW